MGLRRPRCWRWKKIWVMQKAPGDVVFGPQRLALDAARGVLAIGGGLQSTMVGLKGGGFLWFRLEDSAVVR